MYQIGSKAQTSTRLRLTCNPGLKLIQNKSNKINGHYGRSLQALTLKDPFFGPVSY